MKKRTDLTTLFIGGILNGAQSLAGSALDGVRRATHLFTRNLARRFFLYFFVFLGSMFILTGLAQFVSIQYAFPGSGEVVVGIGILIAALVIYTSTKGEV